MGERCYGRYTPATGSMGGDDAVIALLNEQLRVYGDRFFADVMAVADLYRYPGRLFDCP
ncbi:hypothetical protein [Rhodococcus koreensis]|uniref:hypothetical protein n=1 Tax=Rhodococcus koreensis TaxID=99653 RepID=UPI0036D763DF